MNTGTQNTTPQMARPPRIGPSLSDGYATFSKLQNFRTHPPHPLSQSRDINRLTTKKKIAHHLQFSVWRQPITSYYVDAFAVPAITSLANPSLRYKRGSDAVHAGGRRRPSNDGHSQSERFLLFVFFFWSSVNSRQSVRSLIKGVMSA